MSKKKTYEGICLQVLEAGESFISEKSPAQMASTIKYNKKEVSSKRMILTLAEDGELTSKYAWEYIILGDKEEEEEEEEAPSDLEF